MNEVLRRMRIDAPEFRLEKRADGVDLPVLVGYAAKFNIMTDLGWFTESVAPGAFAETIARPDDIRALFNHEPNFVLGRNKAKTLELLEDNVGLVSRIYPPDTSLGRDLVKSIERGDITQMSFGFWVESEQSRFEEGKKPHYTLIKVRLFDVSPVTFPAYEDTEIDVKRAVRHRLEDLNIRAKAEFDRRTREIKLLKLQTT